MTSTESLTYDPMVVMGDCGDRLWFEICGYDSARLTVLSRHGSDKVSILPMSYEALDSLRNEITIVLSTMSAQRLATFPPGFLDSDDDPTESVPDDLPF